MRAKALKAKQQQIKAGGRRPAGSSANQIAVLLGTLTKKKTEAQVAGLQAEVRLSAVLTCVASAVPSGVKRQPKEKKEVEKTI